MPAQALLRSALAAALPAALLAALAPAPAFAQQVGRAGAVNPASSGTPPGASSRVLEIGSNVVFKERIKTTASGTVQLIFVDKTTLNVGPNSDITIDEFVYNPATGTGRMAMSMAKGVMRFVGGNTSHTEGATVKTPVATLGLRGAIGTILHDGNGTTGIAHYKTLSLTTAQGTNSVSRPDYKLIASAANLPPTPPIKLQPGEMNAINAKLTSQPGSKQTGGLAQRPSAGTVDAIAQATTGPVIDQVATSVQNATTPPVTRASAATSDALAAAQSNLGSNLVRQATVQGQQGAIQTQLAQQTGTPPAPTPPAPQRPTARAFVLQTVPDPALNSPIPYVLGTAVASGGVSVTPILAYRNDNPDQNSFAPARARTLQVAFGVNGQGPAQSSNFMVATGTYEETANGTGVYDAGFQSMSRRGGNFTVSRSGGSIASIPGTVQVDAERIPTQLQVNQNFVNRTDFTVVPNTAFAAQGVNQAGTARPSQTYTFQQTITRAPDIQGLGQNRPTATGATALLGFAGGVVRTVNLSTSSNIEGPQPLIGQAVLQLDPTDSRVRLNLDVQVQRIGPAPNGALLNGSFQFGNLDPNQRARGTYIDYDNFGARDAATNVTATSETPISTANNFALSSNHGLMASSATTNVQSYFPNVTFCDCQFLRWGFWSDETQQAGFSDRIHLGTWVAGTPSDIAQVPTTGTATYRGHVMASIGSGGNEYVAAANMTNVINFGTRSGAMNVQNLDGRSYAGNVVLGTGSLNGVSGAGFNGVLPSIAGPTATMNVVGSFFRSPTDPVREMGGSVLIRGINNYVGSGIFAASR